MYNIRSWWSDQRFFPTPLSIVIHPEYIIRRGLAKAVVQEAKDFNGRILDFGCGSKPYQRAFVNSSEYIGVDIENSGHDHLELSSKIDFFYDGSRLPFENAHFDNVVAFEVFEHVFSPEVILPEIRRVMRDGGRVLVTTPFVWPEHEEPYDYARYSTFGLKHLFEKHGFEVVKISKIGNSYEIAFQILSNIVAQKTGNMSRIPRLLFQFLLVFPLNLIGVALGKTLSNMNKLYSNNLLVAIKQT